MSRILFLVPLLAAALISGCQHARVVAIADAGDCGEAVRTRYRYKLMFRDKEVFQNTAQKLQGYHPEVFDDGGIPVALVLSDTLDEKSGDWTLAPMLFTFGILPTAQFEHRHRRGTLICAGHRIASVDVCAHKGESIAFPLPLPFPLLVFSGEGPTCFPSGKRFLTHDCSYTASLLYMDAADKAMAYGIATRLKEAEDAGRIDERFAARARAEQSMSDAVAARATIAADDRARHGMAARPAAESAQPFESVRCDNVSGKDFAYVFTLRRRGGGVATLSDYGVMRRAFRSAIRSHYASAHPDVNPRTLVVDFTEYALKDGLVSGRVAVLSVSAESLSYDAATRKGVVRVRIGDGQFEDARRWIRRNLASVAGRGGVAATGDAILEGARFYSEREEMRNGILEVSFRTE